MSDKTLPQRLQACEDEAEFLKLYQQLACANGEITQELEQRVEQAQKELAVKVDGYKRFQDYLKHKITKEEESIQQSQRFKKSLERMLKGSRDYMLANMKFHEVKELLGEEFKFIIVGTSPRTIIHDEQAVPAKYKKIVQEVVIDKNAIKEDIASGQQVPGAHLEGGQTVKPIKI